MEMQPRKLHPCAGPLTINRLPPPPLNSRDGIDKRLNICQAGFVLKAVARKTHFGGATIRSDDLKLVKHTDERQKP
jgi:hypothetical protein